FHPRLHSEGKVAERLIKTHTVIARRRINDMGEVTVIPGKLTGFDENARDRIAMTPNELGRRMHDNVGSILKWPAQVRRGKGVIDDERHASFMGNAGNSSYIQHVSPRV